MPAILLSALAMTLIVGARYLIASGAFALATRLRHPALYAGLDRQIRSEIGWSLASAAIYGLPAGVVAWGWQNRGWTRIYTEVADWPLWYLPLSVLLYLLVHDAWFYWTHRLMHRPGLFRIAHVSMKQLVDQVQRYTNRAYASPIVQMISLLPRDELANLAESLVALTSLKRRVSNDVETVGGAIDVALISKSDGFVWIKRKYYFPEDLNPQFNRNYLNDVMAGGSYAESRSTTLRGRTTRKTAAATSTKKK